ncbi:hypothetical protein FRC11_007210 [Ceratobasidium sp. 423]|nr:hypothetical protein FRC11_007210 [Ceratobasidium sp. 423]
MNLAVQSVIKSLSESAKVFRDSAEGPIDDKTEAYLQALESDPIELCRASITACRSSGLRKEGLRKIIADGNGLGRFRLPGPNGQRYTIPEVELLRDAVVEYAFRNRDAQIPVLSHQQYEALQDIVTVLSIPHSAQELLSAEKTPTLALAFPVFESVIQTWEQLAQKIPELGYAIGCGIHKIREYVSRTQQARVHTLAMVVNPALKLEWITQHWSPYDRHHAYEVVRDEMLSLQNEEYTRMLSDHHSPANQAARAQNSGYLRVMNIGESLQRASESFSTPSGSIQEPNSSNSPMLATSVNALPPLVHGRLAPTPAEIRAHNLGAVEFELNQYIAKGTLPMEAMGDIDLAAYWRAHQHIYPLLYRIAMDVLPIQASSVSSERAFSSSKMTCTRERNRLSVSTMEALQVLKHALQRRRRDSAESETKTLDLVSHVFESLELDD